MYLIYMRPEQVQDAVRRNVPVVIPAGCVEYHGPHLPIGTDFLIANSVCVEAEKRVECVVAPPLALAPTMAWAAGPEEGEVDFDPEAFFVYARETLRRLAAMGFRRIYLLQHHQGPDGLEVLCLKRAAGEVVRETVHQWGAGWGRRPPEELPIPNIFGWIQVAYIDSFSRYPGPYPGQIPIGHAGKGETQLIMAALPDTVRLEALDTLERLPQWLEDATAADAEEGRRWLEFCVLGWVGELARGAVPPAGGG
ncbi:MAG: creatininase family protein [Candidatus Latescibacteria bacterium]|nr:creatininase family protein [Candidatus Latescibacterota bacterium]